MKRPLPTFYKTDIYVSQYPLEFTNNTVKANRWHMRDNYGYQACNPANDVTGHWDYTFSWLAPLWTITNQRFHIDLGTEKVIKRIYYENGHNAGTRSNSSVKNFTFWGTNDADAFAAYTTYDLDTGWTQLTTSQSTFDQHVEEAIADPKYIAVTNTTAYRYYAFKFADNYGDPQFMNVRRIELQSSKY